DVSDCFQPLDRKLKIYKTIGRRKVSLESEFLNNFVRKPDGFAKAPTVLNHCNCQDEKVLDRLLQTVSGENLPLIVLVNENSEIIYLAGDATGILKFPSGRMNNEITKLLGREVSIPVTSGIQKVLKTGREVVYSNVKVGKKNDLRHYDLHIRPLPSRKGQEPLIAIIFHGAGSDSATVNARKGNTFDLNRETEQRIADIEQELQFTRENLQATIEELETSNEELQATNEELLSSNEELQSTNEELQSVNEELFTVNSEYQNKIIELTELNNDIDNLLMAADIGTIFLDENLEIRKFTPYVNRVIKVLDHDIGRPFAHLSHHIGSINLIEMVNRVVNTLSGETTEYFAPDGRWYMIKVLPYKISPKSISGVVISFIDINQVKSIQNSLHRETELLALAGEITRIGGWEIDLKSGQIYWSRHVYSIYGISPDIRPDDVPGQMEFYDESVRPRLNEALEKAKEDGSNFDLTLPFCNALQKKLWVRILGRVLSQNGKVIKIQGTIQDVTEGHRESLARHRVCDILQAMIDYSGKHLPETIEKICHNFLHILIDHGKYESAWVALKNGDSPDQIKIAAAYGIIGESFESNEALTLKHNLDEAFSNAETFLTIEELLKPGRKKKSNRYREYCFFPVGIHRKTYGILAVKVPADGFGSKMEIQVLRKLAANIAAGIETFENEVENE
ncbi:MAG: PAS domain-containing protein, partial [Candidatus Riflebacteria bacterium]